MKKPKTPNNLNIRYGFETFFKADGMYYFRFNDAGGEPVLFSKSYPSEEERAAGIQAVIQGVGTDAQYELMQSKKGKHFFVLKSANGQETGRSRMFDSRKELEEKLRQLKRIGEDVPIFDTANAPEEKVVEPFKEKNEQEVVVESLKNTALATGNQAAKQESVEKMPRYKFSVIYYPDSKIWMVKNDVSDESKQLNTCDGQQMEAFLLSQIPSDELKAGPSPAMPKEQSAKEEAKHQPEKAVFEEVELGIRTNQGELVNKFAGKSQLASIEVAPKSGQDINAQVFDARVTAKSLEGNQTVVVGTANKQKAQNGTFSIPIYGASSLEPGAYLFVAKIFQNKEEKEVLKFYGSQLLMLGM